MNEKELGRTVKCPYVRVTQEAKVNRLQLINLEEFHEVLLCRYEVLYSIVQCEYCTEKWNFVLKP